MRRSGNTFLTDLLIDLGRRVIRWTGLILYPLRWLLAHLASWLRVRRARFRFAVGSFFARMQEFFTGAVRQVREDGADGEVRRLKPGERVRRFFAAFGFSEHPGRGLASMLFAVLTVALAVTFFRALRDVQFGLRVTLDGTEVGVVHTADEYRSAEREALRRLDTDRSEVDAAVSYAVTFSTIGQFTDSEKVTANVLAVLAGQTKQLCGVRVGGAFLCTVDSLDTYRRVVQRVYNEYIDDNALDPATCEIAFTPEVTAEMGLYPESDVPWTGQTLYDYLTGNAQDRRTYTVKEGDTAKSIRTATGLSDAALKAMNPAYDPSEPVTGQTLVTQKAKRNVSIRYTRTHLEYENKPFATVSQKDAGLTIGTQQTIVAGKTGQDLVTYRDTYVDGVLTSSDREIIRYNLTRPVNALVRVGINTRGVTAQGDPAAAAQQLPTILGSASPRLYRNQGGTFLWPAPDNCFDLSQGYNPSNGHYGIDIISSDYESCRGRRICSVADGVVVTVMSHWSWGNYVRVDHGDGVVTGYAHALDDSFRVSVGDYVRAGQQVSSIGTTGNSTGYHLHFEVWLDGDRVDPLPYVYSDELGMNANY